MIDRTASFVAKIGIEFEKRILEKEANNAKFSFLSPSDPLYSYYQQKIRDFKAAQGNLQWLLNDSHLSSGLIPTPSAAISSKAGAIVPSITRTYESSALDTSVGAPSVLPVQIATVAAPAVVVHEPKRGPLHLQTILNNISKKFPIPPEVTREDAPEPPPVFQFKLDVPTTISPLDLYVSCIGWLLALLFLCLLPSPFSRLLIVAIALVSAIS